MRRYFGLLLCAVLVSPAYADRSHYINTFIGDRAAGMGGAYTAIADGPEGAYYNPAGLAFAGSAYISLSTNAFQMKRTTFENVASGVDYVRRSSSFVPNFFGIVQRYPGFVFGFTISTPDNEAVEQRDKLSFTLGTGDVQNKTVNVDSTITQTEAGPSVAVMLGDRASIGGSLFGTWDLQKDINQNVDTIESISYVRVDSSYSRVDILAVRPQLGAQFMPTDQVSVGVAVSSPIPIYGAYASQRSDLAKYAVGVTTWDNDPDDGGSVDGPIEPGDPVLVNTTSSSLQPQTTEAKNIVEDGVFSATHVRAALGVAWFASRSLAVSADGYAYVPINPVDTAEAMKRAFTWNAAAGLEWFMTPNFPLRFGLFTNNANTPNVESGKTDQQTHVDLYGATMSLGFTSAEFGLNLGGSVSYGLGYGQVLAGSTDIQDVRVFSTTVFLSGGYQF